MSGLRSTNRTQAKQHAAGVSAPEDRSTETSCAPAGRATAADIFFVAPDPGGTEAALGSAGPLF
eukprot:610699-Amphidinium_carterae.2